jgi:uncharacterized protein (DUF1810 family)
MDADPFNLQHFVDAQAPVIATVLQELRAGRKRTHWMWFVFPQLRGLGLSDMAWRYGLVSMAEARAYLAHPVLGPRLRQCCELLLAQPEASALDILGFPDDLKFRSCVTLFSLAAPGEAVFARCLHSFYAGEPDGRTLSLAQDAG